MAGGPALQLDTLTARVLSPNHRLTFGDQLGRRAAGGGDQAAKTPPGKAVGVGKPRLPASSTRSIVPADFTYKTQPQR